MTRPRLEPVPDPEWDRIQEVERHRKNEALGECDALADMFATEGWKLFASRCADAEVATFGMLRSENTPLDKIPFYQARAWLLGWIRGLPEENSQRRVTLAQDLRQAPHEEE